MLEAAALNRLCQPARHHLKSAERREQLLNVSQIIHTSRDPRSPWWRLVYHQAWRQSRVAYAVRPASRRQALRDLPLAMNVRSASPAGGMLSAGV
jgi:hypothetical protein